MSVIFALLTALSNATVLTTQHVASTSGGAGVRGWRLVRTLARHPLWLLGWLAMVGSLVFQTMALHFGPLSQVQPFLVAELVMALVLRRVWLGQRLRAAAWWSAAFTSVSLALFLVILTPRDSSFRPATHDWTGPVLVCAVLAMGLVVAARQGSASRRAALFASATAVLWALEAAFIKSLGDHISAHGLFSIFAVWTFYGFVVTGVGGLFCEQAALHVGPLRVSQPLIVLIDPVVSIGLGLWLFHEQLRSGPLAASAGVVTFALSALGVVAITRTTPETMTA